MNFKILLITLISAASLLPRPLLAQGSSSPYTRFGLGEINAFGTANNFLLSGSGTGLRNGQFRPFYINPVNPASYTSSPLTLLEAGVMSNTSKLSNSTNSLVTNNTNISYLSLLVPLKNWGGTSFGLRPYSNVGYNITTSDSLSPEHKEVDYLYTGSGGINEFYWGFGFTPFVNSVKNFKSSQKYKILQEAKDSVKINKLVRRKKAISGISAGFNASYLFGNIENTRHVIFPDTSNTYNFRSTKTTRIQDVNLKYGVQYTLDFDTLQSGKILKDRISITFGATATAGKNIKGINDILSYTYEQNFSYINGEKIIDSIENVRGVEGEIYLPLSLSYGLSFRKGDKWLVAADYSSQKWSDYTYFGNSTGLKNTSAFSLGIGFQPAGGKVLTEYFKTVGYKAGFRYSQTPLELGNTRINETAISVGASFPVGRVRQSYQMSMLSIGVELGTRGTEDNGLIKENFAKILVGFTMNDKWFQRYKFD